MTEMRVQVALPDGTLREGRMLDGHPAAQAAYQAAVAGGAPGNVLAAIPNRGEATLLLSGICFAREDMTPWGVPAHQLGVEPVGAVAAEEEALLEAWHLGGAPAARLAPPKRCNYEGPEGSSAAKAGLRCRLHAAHQGLHEDAVSGLGGSRIVLFQDNGEPRSAPFAGVPELYGSIPERCGVVSPDSNAATCSRERGHEGGHMRTLPNRGMLRIYWTDGGDVTYDNADGRC